MADVAPDGGLLRVPSPGGDPRVEDDVQQALIRLDALTREIRRMEEVLRVQHEEVARLHDSVQTVDGRTQRHEAGQESAREMRQEIATLEEQLRQEASLRRDLSAQVERAAARDAETQRELRRALELIANRLDDFDGQQSATAERQRHFAQEIATADTDDGQVEARVEQLERALASEREGARHQGAEIARIAGALATFLTTLEGLDARSRTLLLEQRRLDDEVSALRTERDREAELLEVVEQQRSTRARLEDRVNRAEEAVEELRLALAAEAQERALLGRGLAGEVEHRRALSERIEAQRDAVAEHLRRVARADEESHRRRIEDLERDIRVTRGLLVRLSEQAEAGEQEQPL